MPQPSEPLTPHYAAQLCGKLRAVLRSLRLYRYRTLSAYFFLVAAGLVLLAASSSPAADPFVGKIISIDSGSALQVVNIVRVGKNGYAKAKTGDAVFVGDTVKTGRDVKARIVLPDGSLLNIGPDSTLQMKGYLFAPAEVKRNYVFKALKGVIRFIISNSFRPANSGSAISWRDSSVTVETITAVAGVKGTDFVVTSITDSPVPVVEIAVLDGIVRVRNISLSIKESVMLEANQVSSVQGGEAPTSPISLSETRKNELIQSTTPSPADPSKESPTGKKVDAQKYTKDDAARDLAAGSVLAEVLDRAAASGMSVDEMVAAVLAAWVDPYVLVYTALTEGFPVEAVVSAAIREGAPLNAVIASAIMAGGETNAIIAGASDSGAPPAAIAAAVANADVSGAPVYGYTLPVAASIPDSVIIPPAIVIAPSGATPVASPYKP